MLKGKSSGCHDPSDPSSEEEMELEPGTSNRDGTSLLECLENPRAENNAVPSLSGIGGGGQPDWKTACPHKHRSGLTTDRQQR